MTDLYDLPAPVSVLLVVSESPEDEVGLNGLWAEEVHLLIIPTIHVTAAIKAECLRTKLCR